MSDKVGGNSREFSTGARRDTEEGKLRFHAVLSPWALEAWVDYCRRHNSQVHRREENWKKGMPLGSFLSSMWRHLHHLWKLHCLTHAMGVAEEEWLGAEMRDQMIDALCGVLFNAHGYLHELTKPTGSDMLHEHLAGTTDEIH